ncbi:MAG: D-glycerate dehydrogenase [Candidatus Omnitrophica bacterium]|nr:D-glycerate dehydrogenase [bacterium]MBV6481670.1 putative 2-hydroxyacid dehydrogenase [bacterium]MBW7937376.1 D-glycerate dehydrogenase [Candidatus Omnitrophota bacterium]MCC6733450.1 D-glycerate dehydrogenase [Candidatus Omnitrophota bacterium]MCL4735073.1 D-glycerate dehydrogenase [Candidatus Omnitrophota bacterium]
MRVLITQQIPEAGIQMIVDQGWEVTLGEQGRVMQREALLEKARGKDGILCLLHDRVDRELIDCAEGVRVFSNFAVGFNNIDLDACREKGIRVTNTPGVLTDATADLAWSLLLGAARRLSEADAFVRSGRFTGWGPTMLLGADVTGRTLGIIGAGRIGRAVAERASGFRMRLLVHGRPGSSPNPDWTEKLGAEWVDLPALLEGSDFVSIHCPYTPATHHLLGEKEFRRMKPGAILINTARGPVVDEKALVAALKEGVIGAAGLDVYEEEPRLAPGLADLPNTVLLPHLGSATVGTREAMARLAAENLIAVLKGQEPPCAVV